MPALTFIRDDQVDAELDAALRRLFGLCFRGPNRAIFQARRFLNDPPAFRWIIKGRPDGLIAHVAAHEKTLIHRENEIPACGIAEVCVHPDHRRRGHVRHMLKQVHNFMQNSGFEFSILSGETHIYRSSGYCSIHNLVYSNNGKIEPFPKAMALALAAQPWPEDEVFLNGKFF